VVPAQPPWRTGTTSADSLGLGVVAPGEVSVQLGVPGAVLGIDVLWDAHADGLSAETDAWEYDADGNVQIIGTDLTVQARPTEHK
jgi:hypothetical protein